MMDENRTAMVISPQATGRRINKLRKAMGLRTTDISDYLGFSEPQAVYKWFRGDSLPTLQNMFQLSQLLDLPIEDIICSVRADREMDTGKEREDGTERQLSFFVWRISADRGEAAVLNLRFIFISWPA